MLSFNTLDTVGAEVLADLVLAQRADVVVLPETSATVARSTAERLAAAGRPMQVLTADGNTSFIAGTALLVSPDVGTYPYAEPLPTRLGSLRADPVEPTGAPVLVAAHPMAPVEPGSMPSWRTETRLIADSCAATPGAIVAGDLNSTLDHPGLQDLGPCVDAARAAGVASSGTWPADVPDDARRTHRPRPRGRPRVAGDRLRGPPAHRRQRPPADRRDAGAPLTEPVSGDVQDARCAACTAAQDCASSCASQSWLRLRAFSRACVASSRVPYGPMSLVQSLWRPSSTSWVSMLNQYLSATAVSLRRGTGAGGC